MAQPFITPTLAVVEDNYRLAQHAAAKFFQALTKRPALIWAKKEFEAKNQSSLSVEDSVRNFQKMILPFHLAAGIVQCLFLVQMLEANFFHGMEHGKFLYALICFLAGIAPIGCSLYAGYCFAKIRPQRDIVVAQKVHMNWGWVVATLITAMLYLVFVSIITVFSSDNRLFDLIFVPTLAAIELALGIPAAAGLGYLMLRYGSEQHNKRIFSNSDELTRWAEKCANSYRHYTIYLKIFNAVHPEMQMSEQSSPQITRAIQYFQGYWHSESLPESVS